MILKFDEFKLIFAKNIEINSIVSNNNGFYLKGNIV